MAMDVGNSQQHVHVGDWLEVHSVSGAPARRGQVLEILGAGDHEHYRVRWDEEHESIFFPSDGETIVRSRAHPDPQ